MASMLPGDAVTVLEPTQGQGNLIKAVKKYNPEYRIIAPDDFFQLDPKSRFDAVIMNPPFSHKTAFGFPDRLKGSGMAIGYHVLHQCMEMSDYVIALMPWFTISDSDVRLRHLKQFGLISVTALPRSTFNYARIQTVVLQLQKDYPGSTEFRVFDFKRKPQLFTSSPIKI